MFKSHPDNLSLKNLTARYVVALGLLAVTTTASMLYLYRATSEQQYYSNVIVEAGKTQVLLKEIELYHLLLIGSESNKQQQNYRKKLLDSLTALTSNHQSSLDKEQSKNLGVKIKVDEIEIDSIRLNRQISDYIDLTRTLSTSANEQISRQPILSSNFLNLTESLTQLMKRIVGSHVVLSKKEYERIRRIEVFLWILSLIALILIGLFIFRPMMRTIVDQLENLKHQKNSLGENLARLSKTEKELVKSQKIASLGRMVSGFSHELSTPVGIAVSAVSQMQDAVSLVTYELGSENANIEAIKFHATTLQETALLASKNLSRAGRLMECFKQSSIDRHSQGSRNFSLKKITEDTIYNLSHQLKVKSVLVEIECPLSVALNGNPSLIEQLITNLVTNSLAHGYPHYGGIIRIEWRFLASESAIALRYRDDGVGISPSISDKIFEPFFSSQRTGGSGLGLYICHSIVTEDLQGKITCNADVDQGAEFNVQFPLQI